MTRLAYFWMALTCLAAAKDSPQAPLPDLVGARSLAMASASVADPSGAPAHFHNPASLALLRDVRLFGQTNVSGRDRVEVDPKGIAYGWRRAGAAWGNRIAEDEGGIADYTYLSAAAAVIPAVAVGVTGKFWRSHPSGHFQVLGSSPTYDVALLASVGRPWTLGARASQVERGEAPRAFTVGAQYAARAHSASVQIGRVPGRSSRLDLGAELRLGSRIAARAGMRGATPTAGAGLNVAGVLLDVAWTRYAGAHIAVIGVEASLAP